MNKPNILFSISKAILISIGLVSCTLNSENKSGDTQSAPDPENAGESITRFEGNIEEIFAHDFPDSFPTGKRINADLYSVSPDWRITRAFLSCPIGENDQFQFRKSSEPACREFLVEEGVVDISFVTSEPGPKVFGLITVLIENDEGITKAIEKEFTYFVTED